MNKIISILRIKAHNTANRRLYLTQIFKILNFIIIDVTILQVFIKSTVINDGILSFAI